MSEPPPSTTPVWKTEGSTPPGKSRRALSLFVLSGLISVSGVLVGLLYWLSPPTPASVLPVFVTLDQLGRAIPWLEADRLALSQQNGPGQSPPEWSSNPNRDQIRLRFRSLAQSPRGRPVVVYLASPAAVDAAGEVFLFPADGIGDSPRNRLTLAELLAAFRDCPARHRLLILDLVPRDDTLYTASPGDLSIAIDRTLEETTDSGRLCLVSCDRGQTPTSSPELERTVFGSFLEAGLRGEADGWTGESRDGRVSVYELAAFVRQRAQQWVSATTGRVQTPRLVGTAADFALQAVIAAEPDLSVPENTWTFPEWLKTGWEEHDVWLRDGRAAASPRAFGLLREALLRAEQDYRSGQAAPTVQHTLERQLQAASDLYRACSSSAAPDALPTLAAQFPGYVNPDAKLLPELREATRRFDSRLPPPASNPGDKPIAEPLVAAEFEAFKSKPHPALALAAFTLLAEDPDPSPGRVRALSKLLSSQSPVPAFAETALIQRLAALASLSPAAPWSGERAALALQTARNLEACLQARLMPWAKPALQEVYHLRASAEAVYFAPGYAPGELAGKRLQEAADSATRLKNAADLLRTATDAWHEACQWLTGGSEAILDGTIPPAFGEQLAEATQLLGNSLTQPREPLRSEAFAAKAREWETRASAVRIALAEFSRPFRGDALTRLRQRAESPGAGASTLRELDPLLATPLLAAADRAALWNARAKIARRLADDELRTLATSREAIRSGLAVPPATDPRARVSDSEPDLDLSRRRASWALSLLRVGGVDDSFTKPLRDELDQAVGNRFAFADRLRRIWREDMPARLQKASPPAAARLACILPAVPAASLLDSATTNPAGILHRNSTIDLWQWQATRFDFESREWQGEDGTFSFALAAASSCRAASGQKSMGYVELAFTGTAKLTPDNPSSVLQLRLRAVGFLEDLRVNVVPITPAASWVKVGKPAEIVLDPLRQSSTSVALAAGDKPESEPGAQGVLIEADLEGWKYHRRVPVSLDDITDRLTLLLRPGPGQAPIAANQVRVRPNGVAQAYQLLLANPSSRPRKVIVRLFGLNRETEAIAVPPGKFAVLNFPSPPTAPIVPGQTNSAPANDELALKNEELVLQVIDAADRETVKQTFRLPVVVAHPADYLSITDPVFKPSSGSRANRLSATIAPGNVPPGGKCTVQLGFPQEKNKDLLVRDGNLSGPVRGGGAPLTLYADHLTLPHLSGTDVWVTLSADGVERVITYSARLSSQGETVRLMPVARPMVQVKIDPFATGTKPLPATLEVDNAPPGSSLEFAIGTADDEDSPVVPDLTLPIATPKDVSVRLKFDPKGETLLVSGGIKDHAPVLPVELLVGSRVLEAKLLDRSGDVLATHRTTVVFDGTAPQNVHFTDLSPRVRKDKSLVVRATCDLPISGIKEVKFFVGQPQKNVLPQNPPPIVGKLFDEKLNEWRAVLPVESLKGAIAVGVQFTSRAGLSTIETQEVELVDPAELNKPEPGAIAGKLMEGRLAQPGLTVFLYDDKGNAKAKTTTSADGTFEFKELAPGRYYLFSEKESTNRHIKQDVAVKPGETQSIMLELLLK